MWRLWIYASINDPSLLSCDAKRYHEAKFHNLIADKITLAIPPP